MCSARAWFQVHDGLGEFCNFALERLSFPSKVIAAAIGVDMISVDGLCSMHHKPWNNGRVLGNTCTYARFKVIFHGSDLPLDLLDGIFDGPVGR